MQFSNSTIKSETILWIHNLMINRKNEFINYEFLEGYIRNHMINEITSFLSCNKKELLDIYNHYQNKERLEDAS